jgi:hypothetical protein
MFRACVKTTNQYSHAWIIATWANCLCVSLYFLSAMPPRGSEGLDFTPILTHYFFLSTFVFAIVSNLALFSSTCSLSFRRLPGSSHLSLKLLSKLVRPSHYYFFFSHIFMNSRFFCWHTLVCHLPPTISHPRCSLHPRNRCCFPTPITNISIRRRRYRIFGRRGSV